MYKARIIILVLLVLAISSAAYWYWTTQRADPVETQLTGSGTVEATNVAISTELAGRISQVLVNEGDEVKVGDVLFKLDDALLSAQLKQAQVNLSAAKTGVEVANSSIAAAQSGVSIAQAQYDLALAQAFQQAQPGRVKAWQQDTPSDFTQPVWYFSHTEQLAAASEELNSAKAALDTEQASFDTLKSGSDYTNLTSVETRLAQAQAAYTNTHDILDRAEQQDNQSLTDAAQQSFDTAKSELEAAQKAYSDLLDSKKADTILNARARLATAQERYDTAQDRYHALLTGKDSPQVQVAAAALAQAQSNVAMAQTKATQAQTAVDQAQAAIDLLNVQVQKMVITAPVSGTVIARNIEPGELIQPGSAAITLGELRHLTITVYIPENRYGEIHLGDTAQVKVDSFPNQLFHATVTRISSQAEFTPRNVQTVEGRSTTVYAVQLSVQDSNGRLTPGMPADVTFTKK